MKTILFLLATFVAACVPGEQALTPPTAELVQPVSGTRIKARREVVSYTTADGLNQEIRGTISLYDDTLGVPCSAEYTSDGVLRCVPNERTYNTPLSETLYFSSTFLDASCTQGVASTPRMSVCAALVTPKYARQPKYAITPISCPLDIRPSAGHAVFYEVGKEIKATLRIYSKEWGGSCRDLGYVSAFDVRTNYVFEIVRSVPDTTFAAITESVRLDPLP